MIKVPWAEPIEKALKPYHGLVGLGIVVVVVASIWVLFKGNATAKTAWFVWLITP